MDKGKKLRLKRKIPTDFVSAAIESKQTDAIYVKDLISPNDEEECMVVSSESEGELRDVDKQRTKLNTTNERVYTNFLDVDSVHLRTLRDVIMKTSQKTLTPLSAFPDFPQQEMDSPCRKQNVSLDDIKQFVNRRIYEQYAPLSQTGELSPLPAMCDWCRRRKPLGHEHCHKGYVESDTVPVETLSESIKNQNKISADAKSINSPHISSIDRLNILQTESVNMYAKSNSDLSIVGEHNINSSVAGDVMGNHAESTPVVLTSPGESTLKQTTSTFTDGYSLPGNKPSTIFGVASSVCRPRSSGFQANISNSHLLKDRNSNYYALQSQNNNDTCESLGRCGLVNDRTSPVPACGSSEGKVDRISPSGSRDRNGKRQRSAVDCDTSTATYTSDTSCNVNIRCALSQASTCLSVSTPAHLNISLTSTSTSDSCQTSFGTTVTATSDVRPSYVHPYLKPDTKPLKFNVKPIFNSNSTNLNSRPGSTYDTMVTGNVSTRTSAAAALTTSRAGTNPRPSTTRKSGEVTVKSCPLCQMIFQTGLSQTDIDGHIAVCLVAAGDDIVW